MNEIEYLAEVEARRKKYFPLLISYLIFGLIALGFMATIFTGFRVFGYLFNPVKPSVFFFLLAGNGYFIHDFLINKLGTIGLVTKIELLKAIGFNAVMLGWLFGFFK